MNVSVIVKGADVKPVLLDVIGKREAFRLSPESFRMTEDGSQAIYILDSWDDHHYYAVNTSNFMISSFKRDIRVYPVTINKISMEIELK